MNVFIVLVENVAVENKNNTMNERKFRWRDTIKI